MNKRSFISLASLLTFWIVISGVVNVEHIIVGLFLSMITVWFWKDLNPKLPSLLSPKELLLFGRSILMLIVYVIKSNIDVAKILLFSNKSVTPIFLEMDLGLKTDWGRVFLATCVTITPGTVTIDFDPESNMFSFHALTIESAESLYYWSMITEIKYLERLVMRRESHVVDTSRIHASNSIGTIESDNRTNSN